MSEQEKSTGWRKCGDVEEHVREIQRRPGNKYRWEIVWHATHMRSAEKYVKDSICRLLQATAQYLQNTTKERKTSLTPQLSNTTSIAV